VKWSSHCGHFSVPCAPASVDDILGVDCDNQECRRGAKNGEVSHWFYGEIMHHIEKPRDAL
jgi:hypothetical protein